jgi:hypothetical protein
MIGPVRASCSAAVLLCAIGCGAAIQLPSPLSGELPGWTRHVARDGAYELSVPPGWARAEQSEDYVGWTADTGHTFFSVHRRAADDREAQAWIEGARRIDNLSVEVLADDAVAMHGRSVRRVVVRETGTGFDNAGRVELVEMRFFRRGGETIRAGYRLRIGPHGASDEERSIVATMLDRFTVRP